MATEARFIFDGTCFHSNIYSLDSTSSELLYQISTTLGKFFGRKVTTIRSISGFNPVGAIHWRKRMFEVYGRAVPFDALKLKGRGMFSRNTLSSTRHWKWSVNLYNVKYMNSIWTAELDGSTEALFHPYCRHPFGNEPTRMQISHAAQEDEIFLLLVFLYSEIKRLDNQRSESTSSFSGFADASSVDIAGPEELGYRR